MNIGVDINEANIAQRVGVNQVAYSTFLHLANNINDSDSLIALAKDRPLPDMPPASSHLNYEVFGPSKAWVLTGLTKRLWLNRPHIDVLFSPSHYIPLLSPVPTIVYVMDLSFERFGTDYFTSYDINQLKRWTPLSIKRASKVITISEFSRSEIINLYHVSPAKIEVVYPAFDKNLYHGKIPKTKQVQIKKKYGINGSYLFYYGTLQPRKNIARLIEAFAKLDRPKTKLVLGGKKGWFYDQFFDLVKTHRLQDQVIFTGFIPNEDIPALLKSSRGYVLPSLYEGFGMPPVEAQAVGVPVVCSKVSSLPEIVGPSGIYIDDPFSIDNIKLSLEKLLNLSTKERLDIIKSGKENAKRFDWNLSAQRIIAICRSLCKNSSLKP